MKISIANFLYFLVAIIYYSCFLQIANYYCHFAFLCCFFCYFLIKLPRNLFGLYLLNWIGGHSIVWVWSYTLLRELFDLPIVQYDYYRLILFNLMIVPISFLPHPSFYQSNLKELIENINFRSKLLSSLKISTIVTTIVLICYVSVGGLTAREEIGNYVISTDYFYYVRAFLFLFFIHCFLVGLLYDCSTTVSKILLAGVLLSQLIGGHRGDLITNILCFVIGYCLTHNINFQQILNILLGFIVTTSLFFYVGISRLEYNGTFGSKFSTFPTFDITQLQETLERVSEPSAQQVVNYTVTGEYDYFFFENFDRLLTIPFPALLIDKKNNDDGPEVLEKYYGYELNEFVSVPVVLLSDIFRRFGLIGVPIFSVIFYYIILTIFNLIRYQIEAGRLSFLLCGGFLAIKLLSLPTFGVLGTLSFFLYDLPKIFLILSFLFDYLINKIGEKY